MDYIVNDLLIEVEEKKQSNLARIRRYKGYTQALLAEKTGMSLRTLQQYENFARDINRASVCTVLVLAKALDCSIEDIIEPDNLAQSIRVHR